MSARTATAVLVVRRQLIWEMAKRETLERYLGQAFGPVWAVIHPFTTIGIYLFIFGFVFKAKTGQSVGPQTNYLGYLLSGLLPWTLFQETMAKTPVSITSNANLVKQVVFPVEILPVKSVLASLLGQLPYFVLMLLYMALSSPGPNWMWLLFPPLLLVQCAAMIGVGYMLSAIGVFLRDVRDVVQVFARIGVYLAPVVFLPEQLPGWIRTLLAFNPFSHMVWCFQDALCFGAAQHPWSWAIFGCGSLLALFAGYRMFMRLQPHFGNVL